MIIEKICCDYVRRRSPGGRQRGCCAGRGRSGRGPEAVGGRQDDVRRHTRRPFHRRHRRRHHRHRRLRHYCVRRRTGTTRACSSEIRNDGSISGTAGSVSF